MIDPNVPRDLDAELVEILSKATSLLPSALGPPLQDKSSGVAGLPCVSVIVNEPPVEEDDAYT